MFKNNTKTPKYRALSSSRNCDITLPCRLSMEQPSVVGTEAALPGHEAAHMIVVAHTLAVAPPHNTHLCTKQDKHPHQLDRPVNSVIHVQP